MKADGYEEHVEPQKRAASAGIADFGAPKLANQGRNTDFGATKWMKLPPT
jgi:hypothetical protein